MELQKEELKTTQATANPAEGLRVAVAARSELEQGC